MPAWPRHVSVDKSAAVLNRTSAPFVSTARTVYYGVATPATFDAAFVLALPSSRSQNGIGESYPLGAALGTKKGYLALPVEWGPPSQFVEAGSGLSVTWSRVASSVAAGGETYDVWQTPQFNFGSYTYGVT